MPVRSSQKHPLTDRMPTRPILIETISETDMLQDLTPAVDLCDGLSEVCETHLLWLSRKDPDPADKAAGFRFRLDDPALPEKLRAFLADLAPAIVHTHRPADLMTVGKAARAAGVPHLIHSICGGIATASRAELDRFILAARDLAPVLTTPDGESSRKFGDNFPVEIMPAGIDCDRYAPGDRDLARRKVGLPRNVPIIGCSTPARHLSPLFNSLFRMDREVHLALFGAAVPGPVERTQIKRLGLEERVHILGPWARPEQVFQAVDAYFHGSANDCVPRDVLAAQACGKPVTACTPTPSNFLCPQTGRLTPVQYVPTLRHTLAMALRSPQPETTRRFVLDNWNIARTIDGYVSLFEKLTDSRRPDPRPA